MSFARTSACLIVSGLIYPFGLAAQTPDPLALGWSKDLTPVYGFVDSIGTAALLIVTDGQVVASYGQIDRPFRSHSIRKSLLSAMIGIAVDRGEIDTALTLRELGVNDYEQLTDQEQEATVLQLLQARSGVYLPAASETPDMRAGRPDRGSHLPGAFWYYNNWDFNTLGTIYSNLTGETIGASFENEIATPLGMEDFERERHFRYQLEPEDSEHPSYKFRLSARDLARFGRLFLQRGRWNDGQIISERWILESTRQQARTGQSGTKSGYGLMWWVTSLDSDDIPPGSYTASGSGGQRLTILPTMNTVIVHLMDTDVNDGPRIGTSTYNELVRRILEARSERP